MTEDFFNMKIDKTVSEEKKEFITDIMLKIGFKNEMILENLNPVLSDPVLDMHYIEYLYYELIKLDHNQNAVLFDMQYKFINGIYRDMYLRDFVRAFNVKVWLNDHSFVVFLVRGFLMDILEDQLDRMFTLTSERNEYIERVYLEGFSIACGKNDSYMSAFDILYMYIHNMGFEIIAIPKEYCFLVFRN